MKDIMYKGLSHELLLGICDILELQEKTLDDIESVNINADTIYITGKNDYFKIALDPDTYRIVFTA